MKQIHRMVCFDSFSREQVFRIGFLWGVGSFSAFLVIVRLVTA